VVERQARVYRHTWTGATFSTFLGPVFLLLALGIGLGGLVDQGESGGQVDGLDYLVFVAPGLMAASAMQHASGFSLWPVLGGVKWMRTFHGMAASPLRPSDVLVGTLAWTTIFVSAASTVFLAVATLVGGVPSGWGVLAVPAAALCALSFAAPFTAYAVTRETDASFAVIMRVVVAPLMLFSGTVFPISQLPSGLQVVAQVSPLYHGVELCRAATTGDADWPAAVAHVGYLLAIVAVSVRVGVRTFSRRLGA
jgi:lipooligosaccharide transport system permease protein